MTASHDETRSQPPKFRPCPICQKLSTADYHPFCSRRCADIDLNRWMSGGYAVHGSAARTPVDDDDEAN
ncbi:MAG: DNA gyrase inhibitor YacG [Okeania sp. SIO3H1]|nr:DNA gyrase inhibitor YacG [Okeania sp. SIO3H1]